MNFKKLVASVAMTASAALVATTSQAAPEVDPKLATYTKVGGVSGNISSVGSDTLANLMTFWAEEFKKQYPNVAVQIQAAGSSTAPDRTCWSSTRCTRCTNSTRRTTGCTVPCTDRT